MTCGEDLFGANLRIHRIEAFRELVEMASGDGGVEVMFGVEEHVVGNPIDPAAALGAGGEFGVVAMVVDGPDGEEAGEAFADEHGGDVDGEAGKCEEKGCGDDGGDGD